MKTSGWKPVLTILVALFVGFLAWSTRPTQMLPNARAQSHANIAARTMQRVQTYLALYSHDHAGNYPASLDDLAPVFIDEAGLKVLSDELVGLTYVPNLNDGMPGDTVILRMIPTGLPAKELVGYLDGSCSIVKVPRDSE